MEQKSMSEKSKAEKREVSSAVIRRLPRYHRFLGELLRKNKLRISSAALSELMGVTASQIRQDLNCFGGFGQQGYGYNVKYLYEQIGDLLGVNESYTVIIVRAGNLGRALVSSHMFERRGVKRIAMFDVNPQVVGRTFAEMPVYHINMLEDYLSEHHVDIGVLTTPKDQALPMARRLAAKGVKGIWNFSNNELALPEYPDCMIENIHMGDSLMLLCYGLKHREDEET